eukprot:754284-Hanusia_phi.AAC.1
MRGQGEEEEERISRAWESLRLRPTNDCFESRSGALTKVKVGLTFGLWCSAAKSRGGDGRSETAVSFSSFFLVFGIIVVFVAVAVVLAGFLLLSFSSMTAMTVAAISVTFDDDDDDDDHDHDHDEEEEGRRRRRRWWWWKLRHRGEHRNENDEFAARGVQNQEARTRQPAHHCDSWIHKCW